MKQSPEIGDRINDKSEPPDERTVRDWIGPKSFKRKRSIIAVPLSSGQAR